MGKVIARIAPGRVGKRYGLDDEKTATSPFVEKLVYGVPIGSRYHKADEFEAMETLATGLMVRGLLDAVERIWCDSKACMTTVTMLPGYCLCVRAALEAAVNDWGERVECQAVVEDGDYCSDVLGW